MRVCPPRVLPNTEHALIDGEHYVSIKEAVRLTGLNLKPRNITWQPVRGGRGDFLALGTSLLSY